MKCPYCGIHYMDDERECPVCGKRPGLLTPKKEKPAPMTAEYPKIEPPRKRRKAYIPREDAQTQIPYESGAGYGGDFGGSRKKKKGGKGCLIVFIIIFIIIIASAAVPILLVSSLSDSEDDSYYSWDYDNEEGDSIYVDAEVLDALAPGTWQEDNGDRTIIIAEDGSVSWSDSSGTYEADYISFQYLDLNEENASTYCTDEELELYPLDAYAQYTLYLSDWDSDVDSFYICLYLPTTEYAEACTRFDAYDYDTYDYTSFTLITDDSDEGTAEDVPVSADTDAQNA